MRKLVFITICATRGTNACSTCPVNETAACAVLTPEERDAMAAAGRTRTLKRGEMLFAAGDEDAACATLQSGALKGLGVRVRSFSAVHRKAGDPELVQRV